MRIDLFDYELPEERIAQEPAADRDDARLMVLGEGGPAHRHVADLVDAIPARALVVLNDTRVLPARLFAQKETGGRVEIFLVRKVESRREGELEVEIWRAMGKASKALRFGVPLRVHARDPKSHVALFARILARAEDDGLLEVALYTEGRVPVSTAIEACGHVPLPPYIKRVAGVADQERYQTVYAKTPGAVAAPTAGLHLSRATLGRLAVKGCEVAAVTLHVGLGTFQPVTADDLDRHAMHAELFEVSRATARAINQAKEEGRPVLAVGTTVVRALESAAQGGAIEACAGETRLLIQPGYRFRVVDLLLTNFHLPKSTLLALVCAFGGYARVMAAYRTAVAEGYRFFSYGDAMLLGRREGDVPTEASA